MPYDDCDDRDDRHVMRFRRIRIAATMTLMLLIAVALTYCARESLRQTNMYKQWCRDRGYDYQVERGLIRCVGPDGTLYEPRLAAHES
jgi:hypothetical protein